MTSPISNSTTETIEVNSVDQFAEYFMRWHSKQVAATKHMMDIPSGSDAEFTIDGEVVTIKLEGDLLKAFKAGIQTTLALFTELPFGVSEDDDGQPTSTSND